MFSKTGTNVNPASDNIDDLLFYRTCSPKWMFRFPILAYI